MKKILSWLSDPYLHVIGIGLLILRLAVGGGETNKTALAAGSSTACDFCIKEHDASFECVRLASEDTKRVEQQR